MSRFTRYLLNTFLVILFVQFVPPLLKNIKKQYQDLIKPKTKVALLPITGILYNSTDYVTFLRKSFKNNEIKALLLSVDSPGGAAGTAEAIANEIDILKKIYPKPIVTLCENICTSGAYYIAASTDYIIAPPSAFVGSIGTQIPYQFKLNEFIEQYKIQYNVIKAGDFKAATDPFVATTPEQKKYLETLAQDSYQNFIEHVAKHRTRILIDQSNQWANGKLFTGRQAHKIGLIDEIGSFSNAINKIKELGIVEEKIEFIKPQFSTSLLHSIFGKNELNDFTQSAMQALQKIAIQ